MVKNDLWASSDCLQPSGCSSRWGRVKCGFMCVSVGHVDLPRSVPRCHHRGSLIHRTVPVVWGWLGRRVVHRCVSIRADDVCRWNSICVLLYEQRVAQGGMQRLSVSIQRCHTIQEGCGAMKVAHMVLRPWGQLADTWNRFHTSG